MRVTKFMTRLLIALAIAGCASQTAAAQAASYVIDPATGQPVPVVQHYGASPYGYAAPRYGYSQYGYAQAPPRYAQTYQAPAPQYAQAPSAPTSSRGLFNNSAPQGGSYQTSGRGLFNGAPAASYHTGSGRGVLSARPGYQPQYARQPVYAQQPQHYVQQQQQYAQPYAYQSYVLQYHPPAAPVRQQAAPYRYGYPYGYSYAYAPSTYEQSYTLGPGDKLRVVVFGQQGISGSYTVDAGGNVTLPLAGTVPARSFTTRQLAKEITDRLKQGYVREPHVTVTVEAYRPFFILGEVTTPGQYPYVPNMTVEKAIAVAGGFAPRAQKQTVELTRDGNGQRFTGNVPLTYPMRPGDTIVVKERWF